MKFFDYDSSVMLFMRRIGDFMLLNVLWIICSLPIVTIGVSTSAYYYCMLKIVRDTDSGIVGMFFHSFKDNLKQGTILTVILMAVAAFFGLDFWACSRLDGQVFTAIKLLLCAMCGVLVVTAMYVFPVLAQFDNTIKNIIKNAFIMGVSHIVTTVILIIITAIPVAFAFLMPYYFLLSMPLWLFGGVSVIVYFKTRLFVKVFDKYINQ